MSVDEPPSTSVSGPGDVDADPIEPSDLIVGDSTEELRRIPDESVQLTVTSPPYNIGTEYTDYDDRIPLDDWQDLIRDVFEQLFRVTKPDGKVAVNVGYSYGDTDVDGRYFRIPLNQYIMEIGKEVGFDLYDEVVWVKNSFQSHGGGPLFGSYPHPTNFMINQNHEYILIFRKWVSENYHSKRDLPNTGTPRREASKLTKQEWREYTKSVWEIPPADKDAIGIDHDAMFPVEIPARLIKMYSFVGDTVLDPFGGTGTTAVAAQENERDYILFDQNDAYLEAAEKRLNGELGSKEERERAQRAMANALESDQEQSRLTDVQDDSDESED